MRTLLVLAAAALALLACASAVSAQDYNGPEIRGLYLSLTADCSDLPPYIGVTRLGTNIGVITPGTSDVLRTGQVDESGSLTFDSCSAQFDAGEAILNGSCGGCQFRYMCISWPCVVESTYTGPDVNGVYITSGTTCDWQIPSYMNVLRVRKLFAVRFPTFIAGATLLGAITSEGQATVSFGFQCSVDFATMSNGHVTVMCTNDGHPDCTFDAECTAGGCRGSLGEWYSPDAPRLTGLWNKIDSSCAILGDKLATAQIGGVLIASTGTVSVSGTVTPAGEISLSLSESVDGDAWSPCQVSVDANNHTLMGSCSWTSNASCSFSYACESGPCSTSPDTDYTGPGVSGMYVTGDAHSIFGERAYVPRPRAGECASDMIPEVVLTTQSGSSLTISGMSGSATFSGSIDQNGNIDMTGSNGVHCTGLFTTNDQGATASGTCTRDATVCSFAWQCNGGTCDRSDTSDAPALHASPFATFAAAAFALLAAVLAVF